MNSGTAEPGADFRSRAERHLSDGSPEAGSPDGGFGADRGAEFPDGGSTVYHSEAQALAHLDELRAKREWVKQEDAAVMAEIREAIRAAAGTVVEGEPLNRSSIIDHSGLSRRTVYQILDDKPDADATGS